MSSNLSTLQIAALQEMGITVWSSQTAVEDFNEVRVDTGHTESKPTPSTKKTNLNHLRSIVSADNDAKRMEKPFPTEAQEKSMQWLKDVEQAIAEQRNSESKIKWFLGDSVNVTDETICLPTLPLALSTKHKRQLWQQIHLLYRDK